MTAIKAGPGSTAMYRNMFLEVSGISRAEYGRITFSKGARYASYIDSLTAKRKALVKAGYKKEVEETDERFVAEHHGFHSEEAWENFWAQVLKARPDINVPEGAL